MEIIKVAPKTARGNKPLVVPRQTKGFVFNKNRQQEHQADAFRTHKNPAIPHARNMASQKTAGTRNVLQSKRAKHAKKNTEPVASSTSTSNLKKPCHKHRVHTVVKKNALNKGFVTLTSDPVGNVPIKDKQAQNGLNYVVFVLIPQTFSRKNDGMYSLF